ncbi:MAG TPA: right-handed parallel beta-helix repeat-containing protein [Pseudonocardia sp.]
MRIWKRVTPAALGLCLLAAAGCATATPPALDRRTVAAPITSDVAKPCTKEAAATSADPAGAGSGTVAAGFDRGTNTITVTGGTGITMDRLSKAINNPAALRELAPGEWLAGATIEIAKGASMTMSAPDVRWLKLRSVGPTFATIKVFGGTLAVTGSCITSWDDTKQQVDGNVLDGRSYLLARDGGQMTIDKAQLAYLGYSDTESYGVSWRTEGTGGHIKDSDVSHLYFGVYSFGVGGLEISGNDVHDSTLYGIDPHTGSHNLKIENNIVHDNGKHGIILAESCVDSVISGNIVYRNQHHGIVLYQHSDRNTIENNESFENASQGININESGNNVVSGNKVYDNGESGIGVAQTGQDNALRSNDVRGNKQDGVRIVSEATTTELRDNVIGQNDRYGIYVDTDGPFTLAGNTIFQNRTGLLLKGPSTPNQSGNSIFGNHDSDVKNG